MANGSEKYEADRGNNQNEPSESSKKVAKVAAKGAADYFTGGKGGAIVDKVADSKLGQAAINNIAKEIDKNPLLKKAAEKLDEKGVVDAADQALSVMETGGAEGAAAGGKMPGPSGESALDAIGKGGNKSSAPGDSATESTLGDEQSAMQGLNSFASFDLMDIATGRMGMKMTIILVAFFFLILLGCIVMIAGSDENGTDPKELHGDGTNVGGVCTYKISGFKNSAKSIKLETPIEVSNLKVRLMECDGSKPVAGEELVDFEKYILGVTYQENGSAPDEAIKVQAIAARSYSLSRPAFMGNGLGTKLSEENGQWILQLRACTNDHAYCDPDKGCWSNSAGGEGSTIHSGQDTSKPWSRGPLAQDSKLRTLVAETAGQVLVDNNNYIINTAYKSTEQNSWNASANSGLKYKQILLQQYPYATDISQASCSTGSFPTGDYTLWKQYGAPWSSINLGSSDRTISSAGCLVTSIAMLIAKSGVTTVVDGEFNPGTFVQKLNANGGFAGANLYWAKVSTAAPNFVYQNKISVAGLSKTEKLNKINSLLNSGYYVTAEVKGNTGQHWVAIATTDGSNVYMMDPGSTATLMWQQYNWANTSTLAYFKVS